MFVAAPQAQHKGCALTLLGTCPDLAFVRLHDLVDNGQAQAGSTLKLRLKRFKDFLDGLWSHALPVIGEIDLPVAPHSIN